MLIMLAINSFYCYSYIFIFYCRCAYEKLHKEHAFAKIYVDLTDEECLIVAKFHNEVGHYVKELTNFDMVIHLSCQVKLNVYKFYYKCFFIKKWIAIYILKVIAVFADKLTYIFNRTVFINQSFIFFICFLYSIYH